jgi:hypothetical protein
MFLLWRTQKHLSFARPAVLSTSAQLLIRQSRDDRSIVSRFMCQAREALLIRYKIYETSLPSFFHHITSVPFSKTLKDLSDVLAWRLRRNDVKDNDDLSSRACATFENPRRRVLMILFSGLLQIKKKCHLPTR